MEKNLFEIATRNRYRFNYKGVMTVEDLWSLRVEDLDAIFKMLNRQKKTADEDSLLATKSAEDQDLANKIDIVRYIVSVKLAEAAERVSAAEKKAQRDKIMEIVAKKKDKALEDMGIDDLMKKLKDGYWPDCYINTEDIQYNPANGEQFIDGKKVDVINPYSKSDDDEKDRYEAFEKDNGVVKVIISRTRERHIHYMV